MSEKDLKPSTAEKEPCGCGMSDIFKTRETCAEFQGSGVKSPSMDSECCCLDLKRFGKLHFRMAFTILMKTNSCVENDLQCFDAMATSRNGATFQYGSGNTSIPFHIEML